MSNAAIYLGDGLYADHDGYQFELYAHNGIGKTNSIYLDPEIVGRFVKYVLTRLGRDTVTAFVSEIFADLSGSDDE